MRTIFDEAWSECTHDLVYKSNSSTVKAELEYLSKCLSIQTIAAESVVNLMYKKTHPKESILLGNANKMTNITPITKSKNKAFDESIDKEGMDNVLEGIKACMDITDNDSDGFNGNVNQFF